METVTADPVVEPVVETPLLDDSPEPEPVVVPSEEGEPDSTERLDTLKELFKGATVAELRAALDDVPPEVRSELESEIERRGEQRERTRKQEVDSSTDERLGAYKAVKDAATSAESHLKVELKKLADQEDLVYAQALATQIESYKAGGIAAIVEKNEQAIGPLLQQYLPDQTAEEKERLDKPLYQFGKTGEVDKALTVIMELAVARAKAEGIKEGQGQAARSRESKESLAEKAAQIMAVKKQSPGAPIKGGSLTAASLREQYSTKMQKYKQDLNGGKLTSTQIQEREAELESIRASIPKEK